MRMANIVRRADATLTHPSTERQWGLGLTVLSFSGGGAIALLGLLLPVVHHPIPLLAVCVVGFVGGITLMVRGGSPSQRPATFDSARPCITVEVVHDARVDLPRSPGRSIWLWGLKIRNEGAAADFQVRVEVKTPTNHLVAGRSHRVSFAQDGQRTTKIMHGAEDRVFFGVVCWIPLYEDSVVAKGLWYFNEVDKRDTDAQLVPSLVSALGDQMPKELIVDFEVTIFSEPPMLAPWKGHYRLGPGNEMHEILP